MSEWQPIATAPQDKGEVLAWFPISDGKVMLAHWNPEPWASKPKPFWDVYGNIWGTRRLRDCQPTHWMPLPDPPSSQGGTTPPEPRKE